MSMVQKLQEKTLTKVTKLTGSKPSTATPQQLEAAAKAAVSEEIAAGTIQQVDDSTFARIIEQTRFNSGANVVADVGAARSAETNAPVATSEQIAAATPPNGDPILGVIKANRAVRNAAQ